MFERFAEGARRATALASQEARELGHDFIGTEHLLLGLLMLGEGTAFSVLTELDVTLDDARRKVSERVHPYGSGSVESPPFTPLAKKVLERALREQIRLNATFIGTEHLLLGLVEVPDGGGARILGELAGNLEQVRRGVLAQTGTSPGAPGSPSDQSRTPVAGRTLRRWATQTTRVVFGPQPTAGEPGDTEPAEPPPLCPSCQASLATEARYRTVRIPPGTDTEPDTEPGTDAEVTVTVVYCGQCGVAFGIA